MSCTGEIMSIIRGFPHILTLLFLLFALPCLSLLLHFSSIRRFSQISSWIGVYAFCCTFTLVILRRQTNSVKWNPLSCAFVITTPLMFCVCVTVSCATTCSNCAAYIHMLFNLSIEVNKRASGILEWRWERWKERNSYPYIHFLNSAPQPIHIYITHYHVPIYLYMPFFTPLLNSLKCVALATQGRCFTPYKFCFPCLSNYKATLPEHLSNHRQE